MTDGRDGGFWGAEEDDDAGVVEAVFVVLVLVVLLADMRDGVAPV